MVTLAVGWPVVVRRLVRQPWRRPVHGPGNRPLRTTAEIWAEIIAEYVVDERFATVNLIPQHETPEQIAAFGEHVIPLAREAVNARRAPGAAQSSY